MSEAPWPSDTPWTNARQTCGTCDGWACCREMERKFNAARAQLPRTAKKTWQARPELAGECCGLDGAVEVKTDADNGGRTMAGSVSNSPWLDQDRAETFMRTHILRYWSRERIVRFAKHLMGDECQKCRRVTEGKR